MMFSFVVPVSFFSSEVNLKIIQLHNFCNENFEEFEIILMCSDAFIPNEILALSDTRVIELVKDINVYDVYKLSLNFIIGDWAIFYNLREDHLEVLNQTLAIINNKKNISCIVGRAQWKLSFSYLTRIFFYKMALTLGGEKEFDPRSTTFRAFDRKSINKLIKLNLRGRVLFTHLNKIVPNVIYINYCPEKYQSRKMFQDINTFLSLMFENRVLALRGISLCGLLLSTLSLLVGLYAVYEKIKNQNVVEGWASTIVIISFLFFFQFIFFSILIEFLILSLIRPNHSEEVIGERDNIPTYLTKINVVESPEK